MGQLKDLLLACWWRSSHGQRCQGGDRDEVCFYWILQAARRSGVDELMTYHFNFWSHLGKWNGLCRGFRDNISCYFDMATQLPDTFAEMGNLYRGASLIPEASALFDNCKLNSLGCLSESPFSFSRDEDTAKDFIRD